MIQIYYEIDNYSNSYKTLVRDMKSENITIPFSGIVYIAEKNYYDKELSPFDSSNRDDIIDIMVDELNCGEYIEFAYCLCTSEENMIKVMKEHGFEMIKSQKFTEQTKHDLN